MDHGASTQNKDHIKKKSIMYRAPAHTVTVI